MPLFLSLAACAHSTPKAAIEVDHVWIVVSPGAPERSLLEGAGFRIAPVVNRHDGQGTASVTTEFENGFFELLWPDPTVSVAPGAERGVEKFRSRMEWRTSGWCPIGIGLRPVRASEAAFPFETWSLAPEWLPAGASIEMLTPRDDSTSPSLFLHRRALAPGEDAEAARRMKEAGVATFAQPNGVKRITSVRLIAPEAYHPIESLLYLEREAVLAASIRGETWTVELTFDRGAQQKTHDFRPELPLLIHY